MGACKAAASCRHLSGLIGRLPPFGAPTFRQPSSCRRLPTVSLYSSVNACRSSSSATATRNSLCGRRDQAQPHPSTHTASFDSHRASFDPHRAAAISELARTIRERFISEMSLSSQVQTPNLISESLGAEARPHRPPPPRGAALRGALQEGRVTWLIVIMQLNLKMKLTVGNLWKQPRARRGRGASSGAG